MNGYHGSRTCVPTRGPHGDRLPSQGLRGRAGRKPEHGSRTGPSLPRYLLQGSQAGGSAKTRLTPATREVSGTRPLPTQVRLRLDGDSLKNGPWRGGFVPGRGILAGPRRRLDGALAPGQSVWPQTTAGVPAVADTRSIPGRAEQTCCPDGCPPTLAPEGLLVNDPIPANAVCVPPVLGHLGNGFPVLPSATAQAEEGQGTAGTDTQADLGRLPTGAPKAVHPDGCPLGAPGHGPVVIVLVLVRNTRSRFKTA